MSTDVYAKIGRDSSRERLLKYTRKAFKLLPKLDKPRILDLGCGSGLPTIELAKLSKGTVVGLDIDRFLIDEFIVKIKKENLSNRVNPIICSMVMAAFLDQSFDVIWFEGGTRMINFEKGVKEWQRLLKKDDFLVIHDENKTMASRLEKILSFGFTSIGHFMLPEDAWWIEYYRPLENRIKLIHDKSKNNLKELEILKEAQE